LAEQSLLLNLTLAALSQQHTARHYKSRAGLVSLYVQFEDGKLLLWHQQNKKSAKVLCAQTSARRLAQNVFVFCSPPARILNYLHVLLTSATLGVSFCWCLPP